MSVEFEALGGVVHYGTRDTLPQDAGRVFDAPVTALPDAGFLDRGRAPVVLEAIATLRRRYDTEVAVISSIVGPFTLAAKLWGFDTFFGWIAENPGAAEGCLEAALPLCRLYAQAQLVAGADAILVGEAAASGDLISARTYRDLVLPRHRALCQSLGGPTILHICGKTTRHLPYVAESGATGFSFDEKVDPAEARRWLKGRVALVGWVPTLDPLLNGTPDAVTAWANACLAGGADVLSAGCSLPPHTPAENLNAMVRAAAEWRGPTERIPS
jgi:[methyl-Co(III) methanol-specific corrinoid protein]:coenzyme M methyltransferase